MIHRKQPEPQDVQEITARTLAYYEDRAEEFRASTRDNDVSQNITALLRHIQGESPFTILDFGCGPGRDIKTFAALGHTAIGLDGAAAFVAMARADTGCEVWQQDFSALDIPMARTRKVETASATVRIMTSPRGVVTCRMRDSRNSSTTIDPLDCRANSSPG